MNTRRNHQFDEYLKTVTDEMTFTEAREGTRKELRSHLEENVATAMSYGLPEGIAVDEALKRMGNPQELGSALNKVHQPKFEFVLPLIAVTLSSIGIWNLSGSHWGSMQTAWTALGILLLTGVYFLPVRGLKLFIASLYGVAILGLSAAHMTGIIVDGQPYLSFAGINIKIVDLAGVLFSLGLPATSHLAKSANISFFNMPSNKWSSGWTTGLRLGLFLFPMAYFSMNGFVWPGLLFLVSGLCYLGMSGLSTLGFTTAGLLGSGMLASRFEESVVSPEALAHSIAANAHTDFALRSMREAYFAEGISGALLILLAMYGIKKSFSIKDSFLRTLSIVGVCLLTVQIFTSVLANLGFLPMISAGINIPFISYGGTGMIANFLIVGLLVACMKRKSLARIFD